MDENKNKVVGGTLYLVTTPIGNMSDITYRAVKVLQEVDFIAAEDTRNSAKFLHYFEINKEMVSYHEHNKKSCGEKIIARLAAGESCALITDAGTPAISDPGEDLVKLCAENNIPVTAAPGVSAVITALTLSAQDTRYFAFEGFLPVTKAERKARLDILAKETRTLIVYEAPHKLAKTLSDLLDTLGDRKVSLCRELTKLNEEVMRTTLVEACTYYTQNNPRGEYVLVIEGGSNAQDTSLAFWSQMSITEHVDHYISQNMSKNDAIKAAAKDRGVPKNVVYNEYVK
ncbi:MAG: 16S rRNA (cytidine(1402)-2'-O)-methyltransferase [Clostridia bacterium]|nr:16S rRNA (cytidine(1402)-2'-O)-methyltransferase [Clostridia bacterium]